MLFAKMVYQNDTQSRTPLPENGQGAESFKHAFGSVFIDGPQKQTPRVYDQNIRPGFV